MLVFVSGVSGLVSVMYLDGEAIRKYGLFQNWSGYAVFTTLWGAFGGLMVAAVVKLADSIVKGFATSAAIVLTAFLQWLLFDTELNRFFLAGTTVVLVCIFVYADQGVNSPPPPHPIPLVVASGTDSTGSGGSGSSGSVPVPIGSGFVASEVHRIEHELAPTAHAHAHTTNTAAAFGAAGVTSPLLSGSGSSGSGGGAEYDLRTVSIDAGGSSGGGVNTSALRAAVNVGLPALAGKNA